MHNKRKIAVMVVTNQPIMRDGLRLRVEQEPDMQVVCESVDLTQTIRDFRLRKPDIALIDLQLPRGAGLEVMNAIRAISPQTPLVVLTNYPGDVDTSPRSAQGPTLLVSKTFVSEQVIAAIRQAVGATRN
jgi:DNA-binding NarL/FixJ family response regulator